MSANLSLFKSGKPEAEFMEVSPALAKKWLEARNPGNRPISVQAVSSLVRDIKNDNFHLLTDGIGFDVEGMLINGHHRLEAISKAGVTVRILVAWNLPRESVDHIDRNHRSRTCANVWHMNGEKNANILAAGARLLYSFLPHGQYRERSRNPTQDELDLVLRRFPTLRAWSSFAAHCRKYPLRMQPSVICGLGVLFDIVSCDQYGDADYARQFFLSFLRGDSLKETDPVFVTRNYLFGRAAKGETIGPKKIMWLTIKAWNARDEHKSMKIARISPAEDFPRINGLELDIDI